MLETLARSLRALLATHPNFAPVFATAVPIGPNSLRGRERILTVLRGHGFDQALAADVHAALAHLVLASVLQESMKDFRAPDLGRAEGMTLREFYRSLPTGQYPQLVELADELTTRTATEEFEFGLGCLLDGVELRLERSRARRSRSGGTRPPG